MRMTENTSERLVVEDRPLVLPAILAVCAVAVLALTAAALGETSFDWRKLVGGALGALICGAGAWLTFTRSRFVFDLRTGRLAWSRSGPLRGTGGALDFAAITSVVLQATGGAETTPNYRVVLVTADGDLPVTKSYTGNRERCEMVAEALRRAIGRRQGDLVEDSARELVAGGRVIDAVRLLRETEGLSLTEARARVDALRGQRTEA